jgi:hypothetical protein
VSADFCAAAGNAAAPDRAIARIATPSLVRMRISLSIIFLLQMA